MSLTLARTDCDTLRRSQVQPTELKQVSPANIVSFLLGFVMLVMPNNDNHLI